MITREVIDELFESTRARARWSIDDVCLWGYFFTDVDRSKLLGAGADLEDRGFRMVGILDPTPADDDQETLFLHVERVERHTVDSLLELNADLDAFAEQHGLESYDGMDVGPAGGAP